jgi:hypothetical protein
MRTALLTVFLLTLGCSANQEIAEIKEQAALIKTQEDKNFAEFAELEEAFYLLDEPLARFYRLADLYSQKLKKYLSLVKEKREKEEKSLIALHYCFEGQKKIFQEAWKEIYNNPRDALRQAQDVLHLLNRATLLVEESLEVIERIITEIKSKNVRV